MGISWLADYTKDHYSCVYWVSSAFVHIFFYPLWLKQKKERERDLWASVNSFHITSLNKEGKKRVHSYPPEKQQNNNIRSGKWFTPFDFFFFDFKGKFGVFYFLFFLLNLWTRTYYFHEEWNLNTMIIWFVKNPSFGDTRAPYVFALTVSFRSFLIP